MQVAGTAAVPHHKAQQGKSMHRRRVPTTRRMVTMLSALGKCYDFVYREAKSAEGGCTTPRRVSDKAANVIKAEGAKLRRQAVPLSVPMSRCERCRGD
jgi:hypothetical protein